jgi:hypothetical protein
VLLDRLQQSHAAEESAPDLEVPAVERPTSADAGTEPEEPALEIAEPLLGGAPCLVPFDPLSRPRKGDPSGSVFRPSSQRVKPIAQPPAQAHHGLEEVKKGDRRALA